MSAITKKKKKQVENEPKVPITWKEIKKQKVLLFWSAVIVLYGIIFYYLPLGGWLMAFQNYKPGKGLLHSAEPPENDRRISIHCPVRGTAPGNGPDSSPGCQSCWLCECGNH